MPKIRTQQPEQPEQSEHSVTQSENTSLTLTSGDIQLSTGTALTFAALGLLVMPAGGAIIAPAIGAGLQALAAKKSIEYTRKRFRKVPSIPGLKSPIAKKSHEKSSASYFSMFKTFFHTSNASAPSEQQNQVVSDEVDINKFPQHVHMLPQGMQITLGDLHGNALKLLYTLLQYNVIKGITAEDYQQFVNIYNSDVNELCKNDLVNCESILSKIRINERRVIRLIGDELADRGSNDYFTLKLIEKMDSLGNPMEFIFSNHGADFIAGFKGLPKVRQLDRDYSESYDNLKKLHQTELGLSCGMGQVMDSIVKNSYLPAVKLISYNLSEPNGITIYTHAPASICGEDKPSSSIKAMAQALDVPFLDNSRSDLVTTIDRINQKFTQVLSTNKSYKDFVDAYSEFVWSRVHNIVRPHVHNNYFVHYVHGHDLGHPEQEHPHIHNLDNCLGKGPKAAQGRQNIFVAKAVTQAPIKIPLPKRIKKK